MNWLLIAPNIQDQNLKAVEDFLEIDHGCVPTEIFLTQDMSSVQMLDALKHVLQCTHCVVVDSNTIFNQDDYVYLLGVLAGKGIRTFIVANQSRQKRYENLEKDDRGLFKVFASVTECLSFIGTKFDDYVKLDDQRQALLQLFTMGLPFTSDCFATYLAKDDTDICQLFFTAGMQVNARTSDGIPLLCIATRSECMDKVEWLVENGADIDAISSDRGYSAVMDAVWRKNYDITKYLVEKGANLSFMSSDGQPILVLAVGNGNVRIVELLLEHGADPDVEDSMGMSARKYANLFKKPGMVEVMAKYPQKEVK